MHYWLLTLCLFVISCHSPPDEMTTVSGVAMTVPYRIVFGSLLTPEQEEQVVNLIRFTFNEIDTVYNRWNPYSELSHLNVLKAGEVSPISSHLEHFLNYTHQVVNLSRGRFDPTVNLLGQLWKQHLEHGEEPNQFEINHLLTSVGWRKIHFGNGFFSKDEDLTTLDLCGIVKGYCVDLLLERLIALGHQNLLVDWGGEMRASGQHPQQRSWRVGIQGLLNQPPELKTVDLMNQAVATSGDYMQSWSVNRETNPIIYSHIINPHTGYPIEVTSSSIGSITVLAPTCALADALATAGMLFSTIEEAQQWTREIEELIPGVRFWITAHHE